MKRRARQVVALLGALVVVTRAERVEAASAIAGALEPTQIANFIQLIQQAVKLGQSVRRAAEQVRYWKQNLERFADGGFNLRTVTALVSDVGKLYGDFKRLTFSAESSAETFKKKYPGYKEPPEKNYRQAYRDLDKETLASLERSLKTLDVQLTDEKGGVKAEDELINDLLAKAGSADGMVKALHVTNQFLGLLAKQLQKLNITMTMQAQSMAHYQAGELQRRSYEEHAHDEFFKQREHYRAPDPVDWSIEGKKGLL